jgi:acyl carrier protein
VSDLKQALCTALVSQFRVDKDRLDDNAALFSGGLIDSLSVMELVCFVEREIGRTVPPSEITLENFDSINRIVRFAEALTSVGGSR